MMVKMNEETSSNQGDNSEKKLSRRTFTKLTALGTAAALSAWGLDYFFNHRDYLGFRFGEESTPQQPSGSGSGYPATPTSTPTPQPTQKPTPKPKYIPKYDKPTRLPESTAEISSYAYDGMNIGYYAKQQKDAGNKNWETDDEIGKLWLHYAAQAVIDSRYSDESVKAFYLGKKEYLYDGCWG
jgi:hypothetical protein